MHVGCLRVHAEVIPTPPPSPPPDLEITTYVYVYIVRERRSAGAPALHTDVSVHGRASVVMDILAS